MRERDGKAPRRAPPVIHCAVAIAALLVASDDADAEEKWSAASRTATAITGDVVIDGSSLTFGNGGRHVLSGAVHPRSC
jgi:ferric-dicitrate binding protein FerR (iron transport regulator)